MGSIVTVLHLGVVEIPYAFNVPKALRRVAVRVRKGVAPVKIDAARRGGETTGDVAEFLEARYHVMQHFWDRHGQEACDALAQDMMDDFEDMASGRNVEAPTFAAATSTMHKAFNEFIDKREMDGLAPGVPTEAARHGIKHRFLHPYAKDNPERPSFFDTGTYMSAFTAWVEP